jgi:eukaryotic-like serine/threonine-protein kinase
MTPESWRRVGEIFHQAVEVPTADRGRWVVSACNRDEELLREVNSLLRNDQDARAFVQDRLKAGVETFVDDERARRTPERAGPYRLIREIGHGGMGTVYLAERDDEEYKIAAAIKLVTPGLDTDFVLRRFRRERQILAQLDHPNIARLLDGGTTAEGLPYIVMEYVVGRPISEYCREQQLTTGEIVKLFLNVCAAVTHAHRQFIVHRDLKPGNILVRPDGAVKLLDFGICKVLYSNALLGGDTFSDGGRLMTPNYASPEQIRGEPVTIASDVYSLAAVLYELLTGQTPHRFKNASLLEVERAVCEQEITRPSAAVLDGASARPLRGDLDLILLQALDKDPARRYPSVEQFADDLRRHLEHLPVTAQEPRLSYRLRKLVARRKASVTAAVIVVVTLLTGTILSLRQSRLAESNLAHGRVLALQLLFDVDAALRRLPNAAPAREIIARAGMSYLDRLASSAGNDPQRHIELAHAYLRIGEIQEQIVAKDAAAAFEKARALLHQALARDGGNVSAVIERVDLAKHLSDHYAGQNAALQAKRELEEGRRIGETALKANPTDQKLRRLLAELAGAATVPR